MYETEILIIWISAYSHVPSLNALKLVEQKLLRFKVSTFERLFTYEVMKEAQKVFMGSDFKPQ